MGQALKSRGKQPRSQAKALKYILSVFKEVKIPKRSEGSLRSSNPLKSA